MVDYKLYHMEKAEIAILASFVYPDIKTMMLMYQYSKLFQATTTEKANTKGVIRNCLNA